MDIVAPESIRPHLKASTRKHILKRKKIGSTILIESPVILEKQRPEEDKRMKEAKKAHTASKVKAVQVVTNNLFADSTDTHVSMENLCDDESEVSDEFPESVVLK
ncbi:unnamed protein product [Psylliodes chrysocephalus]|uniref:Uncharacterized protein n=1 Tax=Psylliodes chrysocephalus TaxID=3402493 RepID=A0A9P0D934_9CUCU|nr:unnamed protein product [Psylliodes chrysocephala]